MSTHFASDLFTLERESNAIESEDVFLIVAKNEIEDYELGLYTLVVNIKMLYYPAIAVEFEKRVYVLPKCGSTFGFTSLPDSMVKTAQLISLLPYDATSDAISN